MSLEKPHPRSKRPSIEHEEERAWVSFYKRVGNDLALATEVLAQLLRASGDCSDTSFKILGLTLAQASLLIFLTFALSLVMLLRRQPAATRNNER